MKKIILISISSLLFFLPTLALAEKISSFDVTIEIKKDGSMNVSEKILYDFEGLNRHGIFRDIPISYSKGIFTHKLRINKIEVTDELNQPLPYEKSTGGGYLNLKIGEPDKFVTGLKTYTINYSVKRALSAFDSFDELYWNITGNQWQVSIEKSSANVIFPTAMPITDLRLHCYVGQIGESTPCSKFNIELESEQESKSVTFYQTQPLAFGSGLTVAAGWPIGITDRESQNQKTIYALIDNALLGFPFLTLLVMTIIWFTKGRDQGGKESIVPQYEAPKDLNPIEVGILYDQKAHKKDFSAELINLAVLGHIIIHYQTEKKLLNFITEIKYILEKTEKPADYLKDFDKLFLEKLFSSKNIKEHEINDKKISGVDLGELKDTFYLDYQKIINLAHSALVKDGYFPEKPQATKAKYIIVGIITLIALVFGYYFIIGYVSFIEIISVIISGLIILVISQLMPQRTEKGTRAKEYILGLKMYLQVAEKDRLAFHNAPTKKPETFEKLLPYAIALGVDKQWLDQFKEIYTQGPSWYQGANNANFSMVTFGNSLSAFKYSAGVAIASAPSSSGSGGGGSSGGGFGGGGGGSW
jgi:uncharacterized membrane protein